MGYTTDFEGQFRCTPALTPEQVAYLKAFSETRRMKRDFDKAAVLTDDVRIDADVRLGPDARNFTGGVGDFGQGDDPSVVEHNTPPEGQPGLWCQWVPTEDGSAIEWDGNEKFYSYVPWLQYIIDEFLSPWGVRLDGHVEWQGEDREDMGKIIAKDDKITTQKAVISYVSG